jgi:putative nucleotidyltransferase with HDIG domain
MVPENIREPEKTSLVKTRIIEEIETLPTLPEYLLELERLCHDPEVSIETIAEKVSEDPALTADILKLANSAGFITVKRIESINEAIVIIGLKNLNLILWTAEARKIMDKRYKKFEQIWNHCNKTAFYARNLACKMKMGGLADQAFIAGLLHDIGKIVLLSLDKKLMDMIASIVKNEKIISTAILEDISIGISHSEIGGMIAEKWNFPDFIIEAIRNHHHPLSSGGFRDLVFIVYTANILSNIDNQNADYSFIESEVLKKFRIKNQKQLVRLHEGLINSYHNHGIMIKGKK